MGGKKKQGLSGISSFGGGAGKIGGTGMKFRPPVEINRQNSTGTKPLAEAATVPHILGMMVVHVARKILYGFETSHKIGLYVIGTLILSVLGDFSSHSSRNYFAQQDNFFNIYFVKCGWGWTILVTGLFVVATSFTYSCGNVNVIKNQMIRLVIATAVWYGLTGLFFIIEENSGICNVTKFLNKEECLSGGYRWKGFDISGHCFLLVWNNLFIIEEAKAYLGWEKIKDMIRTEEHRRLSTDISAMEQEVNVLSKLRLEEFLHLRKNYINYTPHVRFLFCLLSALCLLWDVMLICTALYFHIMIEKVVASCAAVLIWFVLYRVIYIHPWSPGLPGEGPFKYINCKVKQQMTKKEASRKFQENHPSNKWSAKDDVPKFMGMPLYAAAQSKREAELQAEAEAEAASGRKASVEANNVVRPLRRGRSRSASSNRLSASNKSLLNSKYL